MSDAKEAQVAHAADIRNSQGNAGRRLPPVTCNAPELRCVDCLRVITGRVVRLQEITAGDRHRCEPCYRLLLLAHQRAMHRWNAKAHPDPYDAEPPPWMRGIEAATGGRCEWCERPLLGDYYCSTECEHEAWKARRRVEHQPRQCDRCGETFTPTRADARYCTGACRQAAYRERHRG
jgi:hypothetical protein